MSEGIWNPPLEARRDDIQTVLGFIALSAATWVVDASRIDDVPARRPNLELTPSGQAASTAGPRPPSPAGPLSLPTLVGITAAVGLAVFAGPGI
ncbi:hypothetical protein C1N81_05275 (plasmid) [Streptomyces sp. SGAir0957]